MIKRLEADADVLAVHYLIPCAIDAQTIPRANRPTSITQ
jgi:hypothetical protein